MCSLLLQQLALGCVYVEEAKDAAPAFAHGPRDEDSCGVKQGPNVGRVEESKGWMMTQRYQSISDRGGAPIRISPAPKLRVSI